MRQIFSVTQLNTQVRHLMEDSLGLVWLSGELSNFKAYGSGHWYFSLKDDRSQVSCAMFRGKNSGVTFRPQDGMQLLVRARPTLYEPRGNYQLVVEFMEPAGDGLLKQQFDALKMKLAAEGLFADARKRPLPAHPKRIGVISSPSGAAVHDILNVLKRRAPFLEVVLYPAQVQGEQSAQQLCQALAMAAARQEVDVLILGRGGGSLEDLWSFNDEQLARAIAQSPIPVVSAVGHETDVTISDFVADLRAPTPSAAAELVSGQAGLIKDRFGELRQRLGQLGQGYLRQQASRQGELAARLYRQSPQRKLERDSQKLDELKARLQRALPRQMQRQHQPLALLSARLQHQHPGRRLDGAEQQLARLNLALAQGLKRQLQGQRQAQLRLIEKLQLVSPLATLGRGYAIAQDSAQQVVDSVHKAPADGRLLVRVKDGVFDTQIRAAKDS
ncbi:exodeoxyribonuclease VII large subunit [Gallaecimonas xiamenensis]|uniref:Exodeoxyribonuclease 7 large subunit n=1 Tax=Gallaecimonas xiamenensis 3-C-1 TaxID=745411 RepID=K2IWU1_9GAMM|nr:exodeoxyribonuclease VII large subunit [Gallaecimonas xiamenensis]EKE74956.1 exodeoxyribonuclease VII large subunit [Gallaecimonas xiamenensis 3-C-1]